MDKTIVERRDAMHMSQQDIANRLGVAISTWRRWEASNDRSIMLDLSLQILEQRHKAQPFQYQLDRGQAAPGRPATSSRAMVKSSNRIPEHYFTADSSTELTPEQRRALPHGTIVWRYSEKFGWRSGAIDAAWGMAGAILYGTPIPEWLQPIIAACPLTHASIKLGDKATSPAAPQPDPDEGAYILKGPVPDWVKEELAEVDARIARRREED